MTTLKKQPIVFALVAILMAMPFAGSSAFGQPVTATANLQGICGFSTPSSLDMGELVGGQVPDEILLRLTVAPSTNLRTQVQISAADWIGFSATATGTITIASDLAENDTVSVNGQVYVAKTTPSVDDPNQFSMAGNPTDDAISLATAIDAQSDVDATSNDEVVTVTATTASEAGNAITLTIITTGTSSVSGPTLTGGITGDGLVHLQSTVTKYNVSLVNNVSAIGSTSYDQKTQLGTLANPSNIGNAGFDSDVPQDVQLALQISGVNTLENLPYSGTLTQALIITFSCIS